MRELSDWFAATARDLPWRHSPRDPWGVLVSEVMLQQTQVGRVVPHWLGWMDRWPRPSMLAATAPADAIRRWERLGYPRRAIRLHAAAGVIARDHSDVVPRGEADLRALPGVGEYTANAVRAFAYRQRVAVLDINVRRVLARVLAGDAGPSGGSVSIAERELALAALPKDPEAAATRSEAWMELGAVVCTAREPRCDVCPVVRHCRWFALGRPPRAEAAARRAPYQGSTRQRRGDILALLRDRPEPISTQPLRSRWPDLARTDEALDSLVADGLVHREAGVVHLP